MSIENFLNPNKSTGIKPAVGKLLIASPFLVDPNFARTVILICEHNNDGTMGFVLNRPTNSILNDIVLDTLPGNYPVADGGPVGTDTLHAVHRMGAQLAGKSVLQDVFWGASFQLVKSHIQDHTLAPQDIKLFVGYAGWEKGQLDNELQQGSWLVAHATPNLIFNVCSRMLWNNALESLGNEFGYLANLPLHPQMN